MRNNIKTLSTLLCKFSTQGADRKKNYINIAKMIKQEQQPSTVKTKRVQNRQLKFTSLSGQNPNSNELLQQSNQHQDKQSQRISGFSHLSAEQQHLNHKIKSAIRCEGIYYECARNKHKLEPRHYALMFSKILQIRKSNLKERKQSEDYTNFLTIVNKKIDSMAPEDLIRILYSMKYQGVHKHELRALMPIIDKIVNQFSNSQNNQLEPKSFQTLKLSANIKMFHSLLYILDSTGSHYEVKIKQIARQALNYILFKSMKTKKHTKSGQYFPVSLKMSFLFLCKSIQASKACVKNLIIAILAQKQKLTLQDLFDIQNILFQTPQLLQRTRQQLFTEKGIHTKYNILYRIERYIEQIYPSNLKKASNYELIDRKIVRHIEYLTKLTFQQLVALQMNTQKDDQIYKALSLFHQAYRNYLIENYSSINEKQAAVSFFNKNENKSNSLYELLNFFYNKFQKNGVNAIRPTVKKQLKQFVNLLCKFFGKLNFLSQSVVIQILILSNFTNLKPILTQFLEINTYAPNSFKKQGKRYFFNNDKLLMLQKFMQMIKYERVFLQNCPSQYQVFIKTNLKNMLKYIFKTNNAINVQKYAFYLAKLYSNEADSIPKIKELIDLVNKTYVKQSWDNRSFKKQEVDIIYNEKEYFLQVSRQRTIQFQNQADLFGQNFSQNQMAEGSQSSDPLLAALQNDRQFLKKHYDLESKLRNKLRKLFRNFKFVILFLENLKINHLRNQILDTHRMQISIDQLINDQTYGKLLQNFKTQIECLKFQRLFTKENCSDVWQIRDFMSGIWQRTLSQVQVRNQFLMHKNMKEKAKQSHSQEKTSVEQEQRPQNQTKSNAQKEDTQQKTQTLLRRDSQRIAFEEEQESQQEQNQFTEQIQFLSGKDILELQSLRNYKQRRLKSSQHFFVKNRQILNELARITNSFKDISQSIWVSQQVQKLYNEGSKVEQSGDNLEYFHPFLNKMLSYYNKIIQTDVNESPMIIYDLASLDQEKVVKQNLVQVLSLNLQTKNQQSQHKHTHLLRVFKKQFYGLNQMSVLKLKGKQNKTKDLQKAIHTNNLQVYYVISSKTRKNLKKVSKKEPPNKNAQQQSQQLGKQSFDKQSI